MDDSLTELVTGWQEGRVPLQRARDAVLTQTYEYLRRRHRRDEDDVSEFLLDFHSKIEGMMARFHHRGLPFRHFLLRSLTWQWKTFQSQRIRQTLEEEALGQWATTELKEEMIAEPDNPEPYQAGDPVPADMTKSVALLVFKTWAELSPHDLERLAERAGFDLAWVQATAARVDTLIAARRQRLRTVLKKLAEAHLRRVMAEQEGQTVSEPARQQDCERRASFYRNRVRSLLAQRASLRVAPTHRELARLLGMPKGTIDSRMHHLKKGTPRAYHGAHENPAPGHEQHAQGSRISGDFPSLDS